MEASAMATDLAAKRPLREYALAHPTHERYQIAFAAIARATQRGLVLPTFTLEWRDAGSQRAQTAVNIVVSIDVAAGPAGLFELVQHELQHVADFASGLQSFTSEQLEARARAFATTEEETR